MRRDPVPQGNPDNILTLSSKPLAGSGARRRSDNGTARDGAPAHDGLLKGRS
jgi:hypothetical protein